MVILGALGYTSTELSEVRQSVITGNPLVRKVPDSATFTVLTPVIQHQCPNVNMTKIK